MRSPVVERLGVEAESVTFRVADGRGLVACDGVRLSRATGEPWCGGAFGPLVRGRLQDPRLDVLCSHAHGGPFAFAWVEPAERTAYVAVEQAGYGEVYEAAGGMPVRVSTATQVELERASAEFTISEHDARGALVRKYVLRASVAG